MPKKLIFVLFDSLVRNALGAYGGRWIPTPNFDRFAARSVVFDNHWVGSMVADRFNDLASTLFVIHKHISCLALQQRQYVQVVHGGSPRR